MPNPLGECLGYDRWAALDAQGMCAKCRLEESGDGTSWAANLAALYRESGSSFSTSNEVEKTKG